MALTFGMAKKFFLKYFTDIKWVCVTLLDIFFLPQWTLAKLSVLSIYIVVLAQDILQFPSQYKFGTLSCLWSKIRKDWKLTSKSIFKWAPSSKNVWNHCSTTFQPKVKSCQLPKPKLSSYNFEKNNLKNNDKYCIHEKFLSEI